MSNDKLSNVLANFGRLKSEFLEAGEAAVLAISNAPDETAIAGNAIEVAAGLDAGATVLRSMAKTIRRRAARGMN